MRNQTVFSLLALILILILTGCGNQSSESLNPSDPSQLQPPHPYAEKMSQIITTQDVEQGQEIYNIYCVSCHGEQGMGDGPTAGALDPKPAALTSINLKDDYLFWRIADGGMDAAFKSSMPAWKTILDEREIWQVIGYIREFAK